uniref:Myb-like domain-containing protein n=1 Tax=Ascaris lumbricoides TaxID=6252 RepID=A0A0M3HRP4_ASCLU
MHSLLHAEGNQALRYPTLDEATIESSEATTQPQDTTTDAVGSATLEADRVISDGDSHRNAEEGTPAITSKIDEDAVDKNDKKQSKEDVEKSNEKEVSREKAKKVRERKVKMSGEEKQPLRIESATDVSEVAALDDVDVDSEEEEQEDRKKESKGKKEESEDNGDKKMHEAEGKKQENEEEKQESGKKKAKSSSKGGRCSQGDESLNEDVSETKQAKEYNNHPRALSTTDDEHKKDTHKKSKNSTSKRRPHSNRKAHKKLTKIVQVDPAALPAEQRREEVGANEVTLKRKAKARGVAQKSSRKLKIKSLAQADEENGYFSQWSEWTPCLSSGERKVRRRKCLDLRKCVGALMEVDKCPENISKQRENRSQVKTIVSAGPVGPEMSSSSRARHEIDSGLPPSIMPSHLPAKKSGSRSTAIHNASDDIWSPWLGICQEFASGQPCKNHEVIGFESRECIAKDPTKCIGPFFRYCTLPC